MAYVKKGKHMSEKTKRLYNALPIYPEKGLTKKELARKLGISVAALQTRIWNLTADLPIYEDYNIIGRLK